MSARTSEKYEVSALTFSTTTAAKYGPAVKADSQTVTFIISMGPAGISAGAAIQAVQADTGAAAESASAANIAGATATIGSTVANYIGKASRARITLTTALTTESFVLNGATFLATLSTAPAATAYTFGNTTLTNTAATGLALTCANLASAINTMCPKLTVTNTSQYVDIYVDDTASTTINILSTGGVMLVPSYLAAHTILDVQTAGLDSTSEYVGCLISTGATGAAFSITVLKDAGVKPARALGQIVNDKNT